MLTSENKVTISENFNVFLDDIRHFPMDVDGWKLRAISVCDDSVSPDWIKIVGDRYFKPNPMLTSIPMFIVMGDFDVLLSTIRASLHHAEEMIAKYFAPREIRK